MTDCWGGGIVNYLIIMRLCKDSIIEHVFWQIFGKKKEEIY